MEGQWERIRKLGKWVSLGLPLVLLVFATPHFLMAVNHARVDSEVGVMMHGLPLVIGGVFTAPAICYFAIFWGLGLRKAHQADVDVAPWEKWVCMGIVGLTGFVTLVSLDVYWRMLTN